MKFAIPFRFLITIALFTTFSGCASKEFQSPPLDESTFIPPSVEQMTLSNGIKVYFKEDFELPLFGVSVYLPAGSSSRKKEETATYGALSTLWKAGGTKSYAPDDLDARLEELSASVATSIGDEYSSVTFGGLISDKENISTLAKEVLYAPRFAPERISLWKAHTIDSIKKRGDSPESIAALSFAQLLYQKTVFGMPMTIADVNSVTLESLQKSYAKIIHGGLPIVSIAGAIKKEDAKKMLEGIFEGHNFLSNGIKEVAPTFKFNSKTGIFFVEKNVPQATLYIGQLGPKRFVPDYPAIEVGNGIFGSDGSFSSLLTQKIRTEKGLTYSVSGGIFRDEPVGRNFIGLQTKSVSLGESLEAAIDILHSFRKGGFSAEQLTDVKVAARNSFVFKYDSIQEVVRRQAVKELLKYPSSYDESFLAKIEGVTAEEVVASANRYWKDNALLILVVGDKQAKHSLQMAIDGTLAAKLQLKDKKIHTLKFTTQLEIP